MSRDRPAEETLETTLQLFDSALRLVQVDLFAELREHYRVNMDEEKASTLAAQVVNYLKGEDIDAIAARSEEPLRSSIAALFPQIKARAGEKMRSDRLTREIVVATLRMKTVLMFGLIGNEWIGHPEKERIEEILSVYGGEFPEEINPDSYHKLVFAYHEMKRSFLGPRAVASPV
jgi:hypothetical protein